MPQVGRIIRTGTSLAVVIPKNIVRELHLERGDSVTFGVFSEKQFAVRVLTDAELKQLRPDVIKL